jgi:cephalosporin-C deacetylase-like acetyl esterase
MIVSCLNIPLRATCMVVLMLLGISAAAQQPTPTPSDRPTLNRHPSGSAPDSSAAPTPSPSPAKSATPAPGNEAAQPGTLEEPGKLSYPDLIPRFDYSSRVSLDQRETNVEMRGNVRLIELNYAGANDERVPAYVLIPHGNGPFPAIIWGHWLGKGSRLANKDEFLEEALALAHSGVLSVLIDAPQARHGFTAEKDLMEAMKQQSELASHQVIDLRRAVDLLMVRRDVDRKRIAYVGHSFDAHVGAILAGVETRLCCYVLMAGSYSNEEDIFSSKDPKMISYRKQLGDEALRNFFHEYAWDDPAYFLGHTNDESIFLQFASQDEITKPQAQHYLDLFSSKDKKMEFYDAPHALNAAARLDRDRWLQKHLGLKKLDEKELEAIPQLK